MCETLYVWVNYSKISAFTQTSQGEMQMLKAQWSSAKPFNEDQLHSLHKGFTRRYRQKTLPCEKTRISILGNQLKIVI